MNSDLLMDDSICDYSMYFKKMISNAYVSRKRYYLYSWDI